MMKSLLKIFAGGVVALLCSCGPGVGDYQEALPGDYYFYSMGGSQKFIAPEVWDDSTPIVPSEVVGYEAFGSKVIARRKVVHDVEYYAKIDEEGGSSKVVYDYWILDTSKGSVQGRMEARAFVDFVEVALPEAMYSKVYKKAKSELH